MYATAKKCAKLWIVGVYCRYTRELISFQTYDSFREAKFAHIERLTQARQSGERVLVTCEPSVCRD